MYGKYNHGNCFNSVLKTAMTQCTGASVVAAPRLIDAHCITSFAISKQTSLFR